MLIRAYNLTKNGITRSFILFFLIILYLLKKKKNGASRYPIFTQILLELTYLNLLRRSMGALELKYQDQSKYIVQSSLKLNVKLIAYLHAKERI